MIRTFYVTNLSATLYDCGKKIAIFAHEGIPRKLGKIFAWSGDIQAHHSPAIAALLNLDSILKMRGDGPEYPYNSLVYCNVFRITTQHASCIVDVKPLTMAEVMKLEREILDGKDNG